MCRPYISLSGGVPSTVNIRNRNIQVTGVLTLLGTPHEIAILMQIHIEGSSCTAKGHFEIPYVQWGLKDPSFMVWKAEKVVDIDLTLVGGLSA